MPEHSLSRRRFLRLGAGAIAAAAGARTLPAGNRATLQPAAVAAAAALNPAYHLAATDGWISMPTDATIPTYHPDSLAPAPFTTYMFGFRNVTGLAEDQIKAQKNKAQAPAPILVFDQDQDYIIRLTNLGLAQRPDLTDPHTVHWHGFRNAIPMFDGEPTSSVAVPIGRTLDYFYRPRDPGTYMYHCHVEDTEHVHMGMTGVVFVRPRQNHTMGGTFAYNDGDGSTRYDREFVMFLSEIWAEQHWDDAHIQLPEWTDYRPDFYLLNGRVYPDTLEPKGDPLSTAAGRLQFQPISSLVTANAGERVLLRFVNLGFTIQSMTLAGIRLQVIAKDASLLRGRDGTNLSYDTHTISIGPGESIDAIFTAPNVTGQTTYLLYNRNLGHLSNAGAPARGGQMTEIRIAPAGTFPPQTEPNT